MLLGILNGLNGKLEKLRGRVFGKSEVCVKSGVIFENGKYM